MISLRTLLTSLVTAAITGGVGFASALYLEQRASQRRIAELERQHLLKLDEMQQAAFQQQVRDRDLLSQALYQSWMSEPLVSQRRVARELLDRHSTENYALLIEREAVAPEQREAVRAVISFWMQVDDLAEDNSLDMDRVTQRLGADALGWKPYMAALTQGLEENARNGSVFYARSGVGRVAELELIRRDRLDRLARMERTRPPPQEPPRLRPPRAAPP